MPPFLRRALWTAAAFVALLVLAFTAAVLWPEPMLTPARTPSPIAIVDVAIVDVAGARLVPAQTVVVAAGRIAVMGPTSSVTVPSGGLLVDGRGKYLLPALRNFK